MLLIPIETEGHTHDAVIVVLGGANVERMREADPVEIRLRESGRNLVNPAILICYEDSSPELARLLAGRDVRAIIRHLQRGWKFRPQEGDHDRGPEPLAGSN
jgi:hypothetical protein